METHLFFQPQLGDLLRDMLRNTQILYLKDIRYILVVMGIGPGSEVIEAGTGSRLFTTALAYSVGDIGHISSYDIR
jgi:tRNA (adenine57-N1/adenine58-N1)-methyltransferase